MADDRRDPAVEEEGAAPASVEIDPAEAIEEDLASLSQRLQEQEQIAAENHDKFLRTLADFDNYRRRTKQEIEDARQFASQKLVADLLPVLDNFERALQHTEGNGGGEAVRDGVLLIHKQLNDVLARHGVEPIDAIGKPFDP